MDDFERMQRFALRLQGEEAPRMVSRQQQIKMQMGEIVRRHQMGQSIAGDGAEFDALDAELLALQERRR